MSKPGTIRAEFTANGHKHLFDAELVVYEDGTTGPRSHCYYRCGLGAFRPAIVFHLTYDYFDAENDVVVYLAELHSIEDDVLPLCLGR